MTDRPMINLQVLDSATAPETSGRGEAEILLESPGLAESHGGV